jgi:hypothetical protein
LTLLFNSSSFDAALTLKTHGNESFFDSTFSLLAAPRTPAAAFNTLYVATDFILSGPAILGVHLPQLPGTTLLPSFFDPRRRLGALAVYPSKTAFASGWVVQADTVNGRVAIYDLEGPDTVIPQTLRVMLAGAPNAADAWTLAASYPVNLTSACSVDNSRAGDAPPGALGLTGTVSRRVRLSPVRLNPGATFAAYAADNGMIDTQSLPPILSNARADGTGGVQLTVAPPRWPAAPFRTLRQKCDAVSPGLHRQLFQAPRIKMDANTMRRVWTTGPIPVSQYADFILPGVPVPSLLHPLGYMWQGHDHSNS